MTPFIIVAPARSGSTLLREMLNRHPEICCHGEVFGEHRINGFSFHGTRLPDPDPDQGIKQRNADPVRFLADAVYASNRPFIGFKLLYSQLLRLPFAPVAAHLIAMPGLKVVHLWRRDLIARHVSEARLRAGAVGRNDAEKARRLLEQSLRPAAVERSCRVNIGARACAEQIFSRKPALSVCYEDFITDQATQSGRLCEFLGVKAAGWPKLPAKNDREESDPVIERLRAVPRLASYVSCD